MRFLPARFLVARARLRSSREASPSPAGGAPPLPSGRYTSPAYRVPASLAICQREQQLSELAGHGGLTSSRASLSTLTRIAVSSSLEWLASAAVTKIRDGSFWDMCTWGPTSRAGAGTLTRTAMSQECWALPARL